MSIASDVVTSLEDVRTLLDSIESAGWEIHDELAVVALRSASTRDPADLTRTLDALQPIVVDARFYGRIAESTLVVRYRNGDAHVAQFPDRSPTDLFDDRSQRRQAEAVWASGEGALALPLDWHVEVEVDLARLLPQQPSARFRVTRFASTVEAAFRRLPFWELGQLIPNDQQTRTVFMALDAPDDRVDLGSLSLCGPNASIVELPKAARASDAAVRNDAPDLPNPEALVAPTARDNPEAGRHFWKSLTTYIADCGGSAALSELSSELRLRDEGEIRLIFKGFRTIHLVLREPIKGSDDVLLIYRWAFAEPSPDRLLAIQQVASLQDSSSLVDNIHDLRASAEIVYAGLRNDAVAEAVKGYRDAYSQALDAARQTVRGSQDLTKSAVERAIAALVAVGAVLIARAGTTLTPALSEQLLYGVAAFLGVLATFSVFIEGPLIGATLKHLEKDLALGSPLLTQDQISKLVQAETVEAAKTRGKRVRFTVPALYVVGAAVILLLAIPNVRS
jgi:hypothetical protein